MITGEIDPVTLKYTPKIIGAIRKRVDSEQDRKIGEEQETLPESRNQGI